MAKLRHREGAINLAAKADSSIPPSVEIGPGTAGRPTHVDPLTSPVVAPPAVEHAMHGGQRKESELGVRLHPSERRVLLVLVDLLLVNGALLVALLTLSTIPREQIWHITSLRWYVTLALVWVIVAGVFDLYNLMRAASGTTGLLFAGSAALSAALLYQAIPTVTPPPTRRVFVFGFVGLMTAAITLWRLFYARVLNQISFQQRVLVIGRGSAVRAQAEALGQMADDPHANPFRGTGYRVVGIIEEIPKQVGLDSANTVVRAIRSRHIDEVLVAGDAMLSEPLREAILDCRELAIPVRPLLQAYEQLTSRLPVAYASRDLRLVLGELDTPTARIYQAVKRIMDISMAFLGLCVVGILIPAVALSNALSSPGPVFYRQQRVGRAGRPFAVIKFRTMCTDAEKAAAVWASAKDQRVTPLGRILRRTRIDELPQVINVLRGEMSMVGPRPERPQFVGEISRELPIYRARHAVLPGITGWAQIRYPYGNSIEDARIKLEYDLYYVKHANLFLDLMIILQTPLVMLSLQGY